MNKKLRTFGFWLIRYFLVDIYIESEAKKGRSHTQIAYSCILGWFIIALTVIVIFALTVGYFAPKYAILAPVVLVGALA